MVTTFLSQTDILCLRERERDLLNCFAAEVSQHQAQGVSKEQTFTMTYQLAEDLGKAFADLAIMQTFIEAEATVSAGQLKVGYSIRFEDCTSEKDSYQIYEG